MSDKGVNDHRPASSAVVVPSVVLPLFRVIVAPLSAVPFTVGVVSLVAAPFATGPVTGVTLSSTPVIEGAAGAAVSITREKAADGRLSFPALSVAVAVRL